MSASSTGVSSRVSPRTATTSSIGIDTTIIHIAGVERRVGNVRTRQTLKSRVGLTLVGVGALLAGVLLGGQIIIAFAQEDEVAEGTNEPVALGPSILVATGKASNGASWALSAYDSDRGLCMSFGFGPGSAGACGAKIDVTAN